MQNVTGPILAKVLEYIKEHGETDGDEPDAKPKKSEEELKSFDADFVKVDQSTLFELIMVCRTPHDLAPPWHCVQVTNRQSVSQAANYMDSKDLLDLTCLTVANMIKGMDLWHFFSFVVVDEPPPFPVLPKRPRRSNRMGVLYSITGNGHFALPGMTCLH